MAEENEPCEQCGLCCKIFGDRISPTMMNLFQWQQNDRNDILRYFFALRRDGSWVNCSSLMTEELSDLVTIELRDPITGNYLAVCPFLLRTSRSRYICSIHETKPEMCGNYLPWIWGETYFNKCKALKRKEGLFSGDCKNFHID